MATTLPQVNSPDSLRGMSHPEGSAQQFVSRLSLMGRRTGQVKTLGGFKKQHHTVPDAINPATVSFLGKLCAAELASEGEQWYQRAKSAFAYRRNDLTLEVTSPLAVLTAKDFTLEIAYAFEAADPTGYEVTHTLHNLSDPTLVQQSDFDELFAGMFDGILFALVKGLRVESVIDAVESQTSADGLTVSYPSDCRHCVLRVAGVAAEVVCDGATLVLQFNRAGSPSELVAAFDEVRSAFVLSKDRVLAGLL